MNFTRVRAVLFDLDGTLYRQAPLRALMALELAVLPLYRPFGARLEWRALQAFRHAQERLRGAVDALPPGTQLELAAADSGLPVARVRTAVDEWIMSRPLKYLPLCRATGLGALLGTLDRAGLRAGVLSDYPADTKLKALGLADRFSPVLCSTDPEIAAFKPSPRGYLRACEIWRLEPVEVLFVGDRAEVDAAGAAAAGMPCAIVGPGRSGSETAGYRTFRSLERLSRVLDNR